MPENSLGNYSPRLVIFPIAAPMKCWSEIRTKRRSLGAEKAQIGISKSREVGLRTPEVYRKPSFAFLLPQYNGSVHADPWSSVEYRFQGL